MTTYKDSLIGEKENLEYSIKNLINFKKYFEISSTYINQVEIVNEQLIAMNSYKDCLLKRIRILEDEEDALRSKIQKIREDDNNNN